MHWAGVLTHVAISKGPVPLGRFIGRQISKGHFQRRERVLLFPAPVAERMVFEAEGTASRAVERAEVVVGVVGDRVVVIARQ